MSASLYLPENRDVPKPAAGNLKRIVRLAAETLGVSICALIGCAGEKKWIEACHGIDNRALEPFLALFGPGGIRFDKTTLVTNAPDHPLLSGLPLVAGTARVRFFAAVPLAHPRPGRQAILCALDSRALTLSPLQVTWLDDFAALASAALAPGEPAKDFPGRQFDEESRQRLLERLISAQEDERRSIARELHDETGQAMTSMLLTLRTIEDAANLEDVQRTARALRQTMAQTMKGIAQLARGLHPSALDDLGLVPAIRHYTREYARLNHLNVNFDTFGMDLVDLPVPVRVTLFRIVQEALTNIVRHAAARTIFIRLDRYQDSVGLAVLDDGRGFDAQSAVASAAPANQLGLFGMRERALVLGGTLEVESVPGRGTTLSVRIPVAS